MIKRKKERSLDGIPTSSMSDIAFLLLVFFLTTTKFDIKKGLGLVLPPASENADTKVKLKDENITKIYVRQDGVVTIDEVEIPLTGIRAKVEDVIRNNPDMVISLRTDRMSRYKFMVRVLEEVKLAGAEKISLSTNALN